MVLDDDGKRLLELLVERIKKAVPGKPETYIQYKEVHDQLGLEMQGFTYGESLKRQGLVSLAEVTAANNHPAITGLIIEKQTSMPGEGYFSLFSRPGEDFDWWKNQIQLSKDFDWSSYLDKKVSRATPTIQPNSISPDKVTVGAEYSRKELSELFAKPDLATSREGPYVRDGERYGIYFVTLDKSNVEPTVAYNDYFDDGMFFWESQSLNTQDHKIIKRLENGAYIPLLFVREFAKIKGVTQPYIFAGRLVDPIIDPDSDKPVKVCFNPIDITDPVQTSLQHLVAWQPQLDRRVKRPDTFMKHINQKRGNNGQGRELDSATRIAIELHAMNSATAHYSELGYVVEDTSSNKPYDIVCSKENIETRRVEVKGTRGGYGSVNLTIGEINAARNDGVTTDLFITHGIIVYKIGDIVKTRGGENFIIEDWIPEDCDLEPTQFRYQVPCK